MSDTHDDNVAVRSAVAIFNREGVSYVLHAGDMASPQVASAFEGLKAPFIGVCGNNDWDWSGLREAFAPFGNVYSGYFDIQFEGMRLALIHELRLLPCCQRTGSSTLWFTDTAIISRPGRVQS